KLASREGYTEVLLLGCLGGRRLEHTLANLCTGLGLEQRGVRAVLQNERSRVTYLLPGQTRTYPRGDYFYLSVCPLEGRAGGAQIRRSEEHTSELQSRFDLVCRLLLEKKND